MKCLNKFSILSCNWILFFITFTPLVLIRVQIWKRMLTNLKLCVPLRSFSSCSWTKICLFSQARYLLSQRKFSGATPLASWYSIIDTVGFSRKRVNIMAWDYHASNGKRRLLWEKQLEVKQAFRKCGNGYFEANSCGCHTFIMIISYPVQRRSCCGILVTR